MSQVHHKCIEVVDLLAKNIKPKFGLEFNRIKTNYESEKDFGLIYVLQFIETLNCADEYIIVNSDHLYYKLKELAEAILFADFGELSIYQNYLYDKINQICDLLNPDDNYEKEIRVKLDGCTSSSSILHISNVTFFNEPNNQRVQFQDPIHEKIADIFNSFVTGGTSKDDNLCDEIDSLINQLDVKSPIRCKTALIDRLNEVNDAINSISKSENVVFTTYLKLQIDEIYTLLKEDALDQKNCLFTEIKIILLTILYNVKNSFKNNFGKIFKKGNKQCNPLKVFHYICELLDRVVSYVSSKFKQIFDGSCMLITIINLFILGSILT